MLTILGCLPESTEPPASQSGAAKPAGQQLTRRLEGDVGTLNFVLHTTDAERQVLDYVHEPLVNLDRNLRPAPGTAASWEIAPDGRTFTFRIDPRATFSDGRPVRAEDVLFTVNRIVDEQSPQFASMFDALDRSQSSVIDPRTVKFVFREPRAAQLLAFHVAVLPEHVYGQGNFKSDFNDTAVGNGPYTVVRFDRGRQILLKRREDYWGARPDIAAVSFQVIADDGAAWLAAKTGRLDEMRVKPDIWAAEKDDPQVRAAVTFYDTWTLSYNCIAWNTEDPLLKDPRVRRALAMAYDTQSIISGLYRGEARPLTGPFTPDQAAYNHDVKPIPFDPSAAAALLQQAGWRDSNGDRIADQRGRKLQIEMLIPSDSMLAVRLAGRPGNPRGVGARVTRVTPDGRDGPCVEMGADSGGLGASENVLWLSRGNEGNGSTLRVRWPDGRSSSREIPAGGGPLTVREPAR